MNKMLEMTNKEMFNLFDSIDNEMDLYYIALITLSSFHKRGYHDITELSLIMNSESLLNLIKIYGGKEIKIPTLQEFEKYMNATVYFYYTEIKGLTRQMALNKIGQKNTKSFYADLSKLRKIYNNTKLPMQEDGMDD